MKFEYKFKDFFFFGDNRLGPAITEYVNDEQNEGWEFVDVKFAQGSASGTGMSALVIMRKAA